MHIERAERLYDFLDRLPPHRLDMRQTMSRCGTVGCWAGWASYLFNEEVPQLISEGMRQHAARVLEMSEVEALQMYNATWEGSPGLPYVGKYELLTAWRRRIRIAKRDQAARQATIDALLHTPSEKEAAECIPSFGRRLSEC